jgi:hypothetical protein
MDEFRNYAIRFRYSFDLFYLLAAGCNFELVATDSAQNLTSPNWPENYDNGMDCTWTIRSTGGEKIELTIVSLDIEASATCLYDALQIYDGIVLRPCILHQTLFERKASKYSCVPY